jgi:hypothetical protein
MQQHRTDDERTDTYRVNEERSDADRPDEDRGGAELSDEERHAEERHAEEWQAEERHAEERQAEERQAEERQAEERQAEERQAEERQAEERGAPAGSPMATSTAAAVAHGPDEQGTVPEDRDAAAAAEGRTMTGAPAADGTDDFELFSGFDRDDYRRRWNTLQAGFVDDPRAAAEQADALIGEIVDRLSQRRQDLRSDLGREDERGETEAMRLAIRRYRAFFSAIVRG